MAPVDDDAIQLVVRAAAFLNHRDSGVEVLVLAEQKGGRGRTLEIQGGLRFDEQDIRLGMDGHCVVLDAGLTAYKCIERWDVAPDTVTLHLATDCSEVFSARRIVVRMLLPSGAAEQVEAALTRLVRGGPSITDFTILAP